jgi:hypothetical protein
VNSNNSIIKKAISITAVIYFLGVIIYSTFEAQIIDAASASDQTEITLTVTSEITISDPGAVTMSPSIPGLTGGAATGTATWTVITNDSSGYSVTHIASSTSMLGDTQGDAFVAYTEATAGTPDFTWSVAAGAKEFGYTVNSYSDSSSVATLFKDNGSACNTGSNVTYNRCYIHASTTAETIYNRATETTSSGTTFTIDYKAESGSSAFITEDTYTATTTVTATTN